MFGFSIQKLLVLAGIIAAVWYAFKFVGRLEESRRAEGKLKGGGKSGAFGGVKDWATRKRRGDAGPPPGEPEDMVQCSVCGAYVPARGATSCGRGNCPYG
jgi:uncharacterized protein